MSPVPSSQDREWLGYDGTSGKTPDEGDAVGTRVPDPSATSPWLRHHLGGDVPQPDAGRDPAWLTPELEVPSPPPRAADAHDTGVPPTLAEEPPTVQPSEPAGGAAYDEAVPGADEPGPDAHTPDAHTPAAHTPHTPDADEPVADPAVPPAAAGAGEVTEETSPRTGAEADGEEEAGLVAVAGAAIREFAIVVGMALVLSFIVKTWLLQAFYIPSGSMEDTLVLNDRVIVSKLTPGPVDLKRGDIIVFADPGEWLEETPAVPHGKVVTAVREAMTFVGLLPDNSENHLIKRVIGLPGDHVVCCDEGGRLTVNGVGIKEPYLKAGDAASDQDFDITVPRGRVWVMGDHRSNSADSRAHDAPENDGSQGSVDERLIVGRAVSLVWPLDHLTWLSNPTTTFAKVPAATPAGDTPPTEPPHGEPGSDSGGVEVTGDGEGGG